MKFGLDSVIRIETILKATLALTLKLKLLMLVSNLASLLLNKLLFLSFFTWLLRLDKSLQFILTSLDIIAHLSVSPNLVRLLLDESCLLVCELFQFLLNLTLNLSLDVLRANINLIFLFILVFFKVRNLCLNVVHGW